MSSTSSFHVLVYNTHLFGRIRPVRLVQSLRAVWPAIPQITHRERERAALIAQRVLASEADVVGLLEVWDRRLLGDLRRRLAPAYPHVYDRPNATWRRPFGCGMAIYSRHPLQTVRFVPFRRLVSHDRASNKGVVVARVALPDGGPLGLFVCHTQAGYSHTPGEDQRRSNLAQLTGAVERFRRRHPGRPAVVLGDLNVAGEDRQGQPTAEYRAVLEQVGRSGLSDAFRAAHPDARTHPGFTVDYSENRLARLLEPEETSRKRLDYVLVAPGNGTPLDRSVLGCRVGPRQQFTLDDGRTDLSDHYPLAVHLDLPSLVG